MPDGCRGHDVGVSDPSRDLHERERARALRFVIASLAARGQSTAEIERKLAARDVSPEITAAVIAEARTLRYLDDTELAGQLARGFRARGYGRRRAELALRRRGVPPDEAAQALEAVFDATDEALLAAAALGARTIADAKAEQRAAAFLVRRGFSTGAAWSAVHDRSIRDR